MLLGILGNISLKNLLADKGVVSACKGTIRAGQGTITAGQYF